MFSWEFRDDVFVNEILQFNISYEDVVSFMSKPVKGYYLLNLMISPIEFEVMKVVRKVALIGNMVCCDGVPIDDELDEDADLLWHMVYGKTPGKGIGVHYWKDRIPYCFRLSKFHSGQSKLIMDALESVLACKPRNVYIFGSASDSWRAGFATEFIYRYLPVKKIFAYDVFEVGGCYVSLDKSLDFIPCTVDDMIVEDCDLVIDDRWPVVSYGTHRNFSYKKLSREPGRQVFFKPERDYETRSRSFSSYYEEYAQLKCQCYECAYFANMMNYYSVPDIDARRFFEIIFVESGHMSSLSSEEYNNFVIPIFLRRNRIDSVVKLIKTEQFDRSVIDKFIGIKVGYKGCDNVIVDNDIVSLVGYTANDYISDSVIRLETGKLKSGFDTRMNRFESESDIVILGPGASLGRQFIFVKKQVPISRFKIKSVNVRSLKDREDSVVINGRIQLAGIAVCDSKFLKCDLVRFNRGFSLPKGHVKIGEEPYDCAEREYNEEIGIKFKGKPLCYETYPISYNGYNFDFHLYLCSGRNYCGLVITNLVSEQQNCLLLLIQKWRRHLNTKLEKIVVF